MKKMRRKKRISPEAKKKYRNYKKILKIKNKISRLKMKKIDSKFFDFLRWKKIDRFSAKLKENKPHNYGVIMFCGLYGQGKTISMIRYLEEQRKKWGEEVLISTNFGYLNEDFRLETWEQLLEKYDKNIIFCIDEIQNEFGSRDFKKFPVQLIPILTQNRKGLGVQICTTAQRFDHVDKIFRDLTSHVVECRTLFTRYTYTKKYNYSDYLTYNNSISKEKKRKIPFQKDSFVQSDELRELYDSFAIIDHAKNGIYTKKDT